jgi:superfamily I DNA/RNA helicase
LKILYFNEIEVGGLEKQYKKVIKFLQKEDFKSAEVKKISNTDMFRAKLDYENRLLFKFISYNSKRYIVILELILNHEYEKSKFLRRVTDFDETVFQDILEADSLEEKEITPVHYLNLEKEHIHFLDKFISFDNIQNEILYLPTPLIVIGSAGSGKTALSLEKLKTLDGNILYISLSSYLVDNASEIYYGNGYSKENQEVDFLSFVEFINSFEIPKTVEIEYRDFETWYLRHKQTISIKNGYKIFEEFKVVITGGNISKEYLSEEEYLDLGIKQSIFTNSERKEIYELFAKYLKFLEESGFHDSNMLSFRYLEKVQKRYDFIFVDEVQDLTNIQLYLILSTLKKRHNFVLSGDSNQIVHPNFFSWSNLKSMLLTKSKQNMNIIRVLQKNYRNSPEITDFSNKLLKIKNIRFGSIDKESTYLIDSISKKDGKVIFYKDSDKLKRELDKKTKNSTKFAILVMDNSQKSEVRKYFNTPLIFSIHEAKGLEYENIILLNFISTNSKEFREITAGVSKEDLDEDLKFSRQKDKGNKELEVYKFYINSLYVAFTRAISNLYIIEESKKHEILQLLNLVKQVEKVEIKVTDSTTDEWQKEATKLKKQGKLEQSENIEKLIASETNRIVLSREELETLKLEAFDSENYNKKAKDRLFEYAKQDIDRELLENLTEFKYSKARKFLRQLDVDFNHFYHACKEDNLKKVSLYTNKYKNPAFANINDMNGLMVGARFSSTKVINFFLENGVDKNLRNRQGLGALDFALLGFADVFERLPFYNLQDGEGEKREGADVLKKDFARAYQNFKYPFIKYKIGDKIVKIAPNSMEYFLILYWNALNEKFSNSALYAHHFWKCFNMDDFMYYIEHMPLSVLPEYRKQRTYVNSVLSKNEINGKSPYNKKLFVRKKRGCYILNPEIELQ